MKKYPSEMGCSQKKAALLRRRTSAKAGKRRLRVNQNHHDNMIGLYSPGDPIFCPIFRIEKANHGFFGA
jgi:hypothetical protein